MKIRQLSVLIGLFLLIFVGVRPAFAATDPLTSVLDRVFHQGPTIVVGAQSARLHRGHRIGIRATHFGDWNQTYSRPEPASGASNGHLWRASFYGGGEKLNAHTANGERFHPGGLTAAHRTLPMGTRLSVCYRSCTVVRVNDRGPAAWTGRNLDLSRGAAAQIGLIKVGSAPVRVAVLD